MNTSLMGQYLLERRLLTQGQFDQALRIQQQSNVRLGQLSINQGFLNIEQVLYINQQQRLLNEKFGDIAIAKNLLSRSQVEQLLDIQKNQSKLLETILVEENILNKTIVDEMLSALCEHQESISLSISEISSISSLGKTVKKILSSNEKLFLRCLHSDFKVKRIIDNINEVDKRDHIVYLTINYGDTTLCIAMAINNSTLLEICSRFMGIPKNECEPSLAEDAVGEFLNCLAGYVISEVIPKKFLCAPSTAFFVNSINGLINKYIEPIAVEFVSDVGCGDIVIAW